MLIAAEHGFFAHDLKLVDSLKLRLSCEHLGDSTLRHLDIPTVGPSPHNSANTPMQHTCYTWPSIAFFAGPKQLSDWMASQHQHCV